MACHVLIVDDDPDFRGLAARIIAASDGTVVSQAGTVATAVAAALELRPGAALVDVGLPDGDGIALARELSALPWQPHVVLTSSNPDAASQEDVRGCGANAFVPKADLPDAPLRRLFTTGP
jgi:two-component system nitrate/nitrite response regulator NarL